MLERWIVRNWISLCIGCIAMGIALRLAYAERGYMAFGVEWLILPFALAIGRKIRKVARAWRRYR